MNKYGTLPGTILSYRTAASGSYIALSNLIAKYDELPGGSIEKIKTTRVDQMLTIGTRNGTTTNTSPTIASISDTSDLQPGMVVTGTGIPVGSRIISKTSSTIVLDQVATASATITLTFVAVDWVHQYARGREEPGTVKFTIGFDETYIDILKQLKGQTVYFQILFSNQAYETFQALVLDTKYVADGEDGEVYYSVMLQLTGPSTFHKAGT